VPSQVKTQLTNFSKTQEKLVSVGAITGSESSYINIRYYWLQAQNGLVQVTDFIKNSTAATSSMSSTINQFSNVAQSISSGNFTSKVADTLSTGLVSLSFSTNSIIDSAKEQ